MKRLTKAEEELMQFLWELKESTVRELLEQFPEPKPAYNTVSTVLRVLESKGVVDHKAYGNTYVYFPKVSKEDYSRVQFHKLLKNYFNSSFPKMAAFFAQENNLSMEEIDEILRDIKKELE